MVREGRIALCVFDELHLFLADSQYRSVVLECTRLREIERQHQDTSYFRKPVYVSMTATMPLEFVEPLDSLLEMTDSEVVVYEGVVMPRMRYRAHAEVGKDDVCAAAVLALEASKEVWTAGSGNVALVFTTSKELCDSLARDLERTGWAVGKFRADLSDGEKAIVTQSVRDGSVDVVVATSALSVGVSFDRVSVVVSVGAFGLSGLIQSGGRAGRRGGLAEHHYFPLRGREEAEEAVGDLFAEAMTKDSAALADYGSDGKCLRGHVARTVVSGADITFGCVEYANSDEAGDNFELCSVCLGDDTVVISSASVRSRREEWDLAAATVVVCGEALDAAGCVGGSGDAGVAVDAYSPDDEYSPDSSTENSAGHSSSVRRGRVYVCVIVCTCMCV